MMSLGRWNMASWRRLYAVLLVTPWGVPYQRFEDVSCRCYEDVVIRSNIYLEWTRPTNFLRVSLRDVLRRLLRLRILQEIRTFVFGLRIDKCYITKIASAAQQVAHTKWRDMNTGLKLNSKMYIFLSSKILSNSVYLSSM